MVKKIVKLFVLCIAVTVLVFTVSCNEATAAMNIAVIKGPTGVGMASLISESAAGTTKNSYRFTIASSPDEVVPKIVTGEVDIAAVPTNLAATLHQKTNGGVKMIAVNTLGVLHILENGDTVKSVADLKGKTIYTSGQGANPEYILRYLLTENGLNPDKDVKIEFVGTNDELVAALVSGKAKIAMVPEPAATTVLTKVPELRRAIDVNHEWNIVSADSRLMMGCVIVRTEFLKENEGAVKTFLKEYEKSIAVCEDVSMTAQLCESAGIIPSVAVAEKAIPNCNVVYVDGKDMKTQIAGYYEVLFQGNPASLGGTLPPDEFYYLG